MSFRRSWNHYKTKLLRKLSKLSKIKNCYLYYNGYLTSLNVAYNCVGDHKDLFYNISNDTNKFCTSSEMFQAEGYYVLTDEAKSKYIGTDGTEVGIYGGDYPFEETTDFPRIIKCDVAKKSTVDGKLSVDIQVKTAK